MRKTDQAHKAEGVLDFESRLDAARETRDKIELTDPVQDALTCRDALSAEASDLARKAHAARAAGDEDGALSMFQCVRELHRQVDEAHDAVRAARIAATT